MTDVMATCGDLTGSKNGTSTCYISNHGAGTPFKGTVTLTGYDHFGNGTGVVITSQSFSLAEGPGVLEWFNANLPNGSTTSVISSVHDGSGALLSEHMVQLVKPMALLVPSTTNEISFAIAEAANKDGTIDIVVTSRKVALWVTLTTLAQGRFSDNVFFLPAGRKSPLATKNLMDCVAPPFEGSRGGDAIHQCPLDAVALCFC